MLLLGATLLLTVPAFGQSAGEKTGLNSTLGIAPKTADFANEAATSDMFEIQSSKLAAERTQGDVRTFAQTMVSDHTKTTKELKGLAPAADVQLPEQMTSSQENMLDKLKGLQGKDFAKQYMDDQVSAHKDAVSLFERYGKGGENDEFKTWASQTLPTLQHHLDMAQAIYKNM
jgi:putative membrane protein